MTRKSIVALAAIAVIGTATIPVAPAGAAYFSNDQATFNNRPGFRHNIANNRFDWRRPRHRFAVHRPFVRHRFAVHRPFVRGGFAFASCSVVRRTWTPWGWRWHRVWVC